MNDLTAHAEPPKKSSPRAFGIVMAVAFAVFALITWRSNPESTLVIVLGAVAASFLVIALVVPQLLAVLNVLWLKFGELLHKVINPLIMGAMLYCLITPIGVLLRLAKKDVLGLKMDPAATSYWIATDEDAEASSMTHQF
ncbi:hypothetical protein V5T82_08765 [Magnetovibrio sp. PR-2]|uniref:hypothetical protein n=1 Tax=Magnetovibrio sp. PR-2 TaxID=3120356 RepID=UPI002FCE2B0A